MEKLAIKGGYSVRQGKIFALHCACIAAGIGLNDEVITTSITFAALANCVLYCGAKPVFVDINSETYNIDPESIKAHITEQTKAVVTVDFTGRAVEIEKIREICKERNIIFIEDTAHSVSTKYKGQQVGSLADMTYFSFHPVKTVTGGEDESILTKKGVLTMIVDDVLIGELVRLQQITMDECTEKYVSWLNDSEVNQYLETKWYKQTIDSIKEFVNQQRENDHSILFAIFFIETNEHIGNIKIGPIHPYYKHADISYFIGEKNMWGRGVASEAIHLAVDYAFEKLNLHKVEAGTYEIAIGSQKALEKNEFIQEGRIKDSVFFEGKYIDCYKYGRIKKD